MILLAHMVFGAAVGYKAYFLTNNILLAGFLTLLSHYFLDAFPHVEYLKSTEESIGRLKNGGFKENLADFAMVFSDFCTGLLIIFLASTNQAVIYAFALIGAIPDGLTIINSLFPKTILQKHQHMHAMVHYFTKIKKFPMFWRIATQVLAVTISIILLKY